jgi:hypothetical protein
LYATSFGGKENGIVLLHSVLYLDVELLTRIHVLVLANFYSMHIQKHGIDLKFLIIPILFLGEGLTLCIGVETLSSIYLYAPHRAMAFSLPLNNI